MKRGGCWLHHPLDSALAEPLPNSLPARLFVEERRGRHGVLDQVGIDAREGDDQRCTLQCAAVGQQAAIDLRACDPRNAAISDDAAAKTPNNRAEIDVYPPALAGEVLSIVQVEDNRFGDAGGRRQGVRNEDPFIIVRAGFTVRSVACDARASGRAAFAPVTQETDRRAVEHERRSLRCHSARSSENPRAVADAGMDEVYGVVAASIAALLSARARRSGFAIRAT